VAQRARSLGTGVLGFTGTLGAGWERLLDAGFTAILPISRGPADLATALARGESDLRRSAATAVLLLCARPDREEDE
jgi:glycerate kinase